MKMLARIKSTDQYFASGSIRTVRVPKLVFFFFDLWKLMVFRKPFRKAFGRYCIRRGFPNKDISHMKASPLPITEPGQRSSARSLIHTTLKK